MPSAEQVTGQLGHRSAVVNVARRQQECDKFATVVDHQMQLEDKGPAD
jgi:hypothetical protein